MNTTMANAAASATRNLTNGAFGTAGSIQCWHRAAGELWGTRRRDRINASTLARDVWTGSLAQARGTYGGGGRATMPACMERVVTDLKRSGPMQ